MPNMLEGKVAVVTGSGRGIGREIALLMAKHGAKVVVNDVGASVSGDGGDTGPAQEVVGLIKDAGGEAVASTDSVAEWDSAQRIVGKAVDTFGRIDIVVNNAGILRDKIFHQMSPEEFDAVVKVHLYGTFYMSRSAATHFRKQESGSFIHMTSTAGLFGGLGNANYSAAKMGIVGLARNIAFDMRRFNVRSNIIAPSAFSRMIETIPGATPEEQAANLEKRRLSTPPERIAPLAVFLGSDAAKDVNGQIFGARGNEVYLFSQARPIRTAQREGGWSAELLAERLVPAWKNSFTPLERTGEVFPYSAI